MNNRPNKRVILLIAYCFLFFIYSLYSYAFLDVNLTLTSVPIFLWLQKEIQHFGYIHRSSSALFFLAIIGLIILCYVAIVKHQSNSFKPKWIFLVIASLLVISYPSFSSDIWNYIFNAKMVLVYHADPHQQIALNFPNDPMLMFMRNIHTPAPYFYVWTILSLVPGVLALNSIFSSLIIFKVFSLVQFLGCFWVLQSIYQIYHVTNHKQRLVLFMLNPLLLIESIGIGHNDLSMMFFALVSFYLLLLYKRNGSIKRLLLSIIFLALSIGIKYATVVLVPLYILYIFIDYDLGLWGALALLVLPFTRIEQLHSWYLIWPLTWVFLSRSQEAIKFFIFLSFFALLRYLPYIYYGNWDPPVFTLRLAIYFIVPMIYGVKLLIPFLHRRD
jgi:hypothetical protein